MTHACKPNTVGEREKGAQVQSHPGSHGETKPSPVYLGIPCLKTTKVLLQEATKAPGS